MEVNLEGVGVHRGCDARQGTRAKYVHNTGRQVRVSPHRPES